MILKKSVKNKDPGGKDPTRISPGRPRVFDANEALERAMQVFWRKGYLGTSVSDLTRAIGINRPSLYAAFGNKESLFRKALDRYAEGPSSYLREALNEPTARKVAERMMRGAVDVGTDTSTPPGCLWVHGTMSCGDHADPVGQEMASRRAVAEVNLRKRFKRAIAEADLPSDTDAATLARFVLTVNFGLSVLAATGATRAQLLQVVNTVLQPWPSPE